MRVAIIADWLTTYGGAEHVLSSLHELYPHAPLFTTVAKQESLGPLSRATIIPHPVLQSLYSVIRKHQILLPLMPYAIEDIDVSGYDFVLSSSHAVAKGVLVSGETKHLCYCHTPIRYAWEMEEEYLHDFRFRGVKRIVAKKILSHLRKWDLTTADRVDTFLANSSETQRRIASIYGRDSTVISPPIDERFFSVDLTKERTYYLAIGRLVPYKRFDVLIDLANSFGIDLRIAGKGDDENRLRKRAGSTVQFLGYVSDDDVPSLYAGAKTLLFPQVEDAGIVPLEAQACGTPVLAYGKGGVLDAVKPGVTGLLFTEQTVFSLSDALQQSQQIKWDSYAIREHARQFEATVFKKKIQEQVKKMMRN